MRRITSILGILALLASFVPADIDAAAEALACCNGTLCPMHLERSHAPECDMDMNGSGAALKPCPVRPAAHYTATNVFLLLAPVVLHRDTLSEPATLFLKHLSSDAALRVDSPPPRMPLPA